MNSEFDSYIANLLEAYTPMTGNNAVDVNRRADQIAGSQTEELFKNLVLQNKMQIRQATKAEETTQHIDFFITLQSNQVKSFEVKPLSKDGTFYAIELIGRTGMPGPLYGKADYLAFCNTPKNLFYIIEREKLKAMVEKVGGVSVDRWGNISTNKFQTVDNIQDANLFNRTFYHRKNANGASGQGLMTAVTVEQMKKIKSFILRQPST